ncbi:MFS transporter [Candidatus Nitrospira bockiana]
MPTSNREEAEPKAQALRDQVHEGACSAVMQGGGESYLSAFALLLHATPFQIGLLSALPPIIGTWSQLLSVKVLDRIHARKPLIVVGAAAQAVAWAPLFFLPLLFPSFGPWLLLATAMIYFSMGHLTVPAWNSLISELVNADGRGMYFARRAKVIALSSFAALGLSALLLHTSETWTHPAMGFGLIFLAAAIARGVSARYLARLPESSPPPVREHERGVVEFLKSRRSAMFRRFLLFSGSFHLAVMIAGPFFVVYLLKDLHLTYLQYGLWLAAPIVGQLISLQEWGRIADSFGNTKVLAVTGLLIPILPALYLFSSHWLALVAINFVSGMIWPGFSLSLGNYVFDVVQPADRPRGIAVYHAVNAGGAAVGATLGGWLATVAPSELLFFGRTVALVSNLPVVFLASGVLRLLVTLTLLKTFRERRRVTPITRLALVAELPIIRPVWAVIRTHTGGPRRRR